MPSFSYTYPIPSLPSYLFESDLVANIIPPQLYTAVPTMDGKIYLHWTKHTSTGDTYNDLYAEVWRSPDLSSWSLLATRQWLNYDYYTDTDVLVGLTYYYRIRFVRKNTEGSTTNVSDYTTTKATAVVSALGFEPADTYSNKFFQYLLSGLPGTRIYDQTPAATFAADRHDWQTTCKITDGFNVFVDGSLVHSEAEDLTQQYAKRPINFVVTKKHVKVWGQNTTTGEQGDTIPVNSYLIHTFMMGYAVQFLKLYEQYISLVADKYIDNSQIYTKGFNPVISDRLDPSLAQLYVTFGKLLKLEPPKSQTNAQALPQYRSLLKNSWTNQDYTGKIKGLQNAATNVFGITTETLLEYWKQHWFKTDRELKPYVIPSGVEPFRLMTGPHLNAHMITTGSNLSFDLPDSRFTVLLEYNPVPSGLWLDVLGSSPEDPYTYLFRANISHGQTTGADIAQLFTQDPVAGSLLIVTNSGGDTGGTPIYSGFDPTLLRMHSRWVGWEDTAVNLYGRKMQLKDITATVTNTDCSTFSCTLSKADPTRNIPSSSTGYSAPALTDGFADLVTNSLAIVRDDTDAGVSFYRDGTTSTVSLVGTKHILVRVDLSTTKMQWLTKAYLKIFVRQSTADGYLRLYRVNKKTSSTYVCWNYRDLSIVSSGSWVINSTGKDYFTSLASTPYVSADWQEPGCNGSTDRTLLKEFEVAKVDAPGWVTLEITDVLQNLYKYETSRPDMGDNPSNFIECGFMLTAEGFPDRSAMVIMGHTDMTYRPIISWERLNQGYTQLPADSTRYLYVDGTLRYGRLQVMQADREPTSYIRTVHERIKQTDIKFTDDCTLTTVTDPVAAFVSGIRICGLTSRAVGRVTQVYGKTLYVTVEHSTFQTGEVLRIVDSTVEITIASVSFVGNKYVKLSRMPVSNSIIRVFHTGSTVAPSWPEIPGNYPAYSSWTESGDGLSPDLITIPVGTLNSNALRDVDYRDRINLNCTDTLSVIGDVIVTYQYMYDYILLGKVVTDSDSITDIDGCSRIDRGLILQTESDYLFKTDMLLPMPSTGGYIPDISGDPTLNEYSDHNIDLLVSALHSVRRQDAPVDVFKYDISGKPYRLGLSYHSFFNRA